MRSIGSVVRMYDKFPASYFVESWDNMLDFSNRYICGPGEYIHKSKATVSYHESARNQLVEDSKGDWVLMLDTDHMFAPDLLDRLLFLKKKYNCRVINGIYQYKFAPHAPVMNLWGPNNEVVPITDWSRDEEILEIGSCGGGCLLADRSVFREIQLSFKTNPFSIIQGLSEDYSFFLRCKQLGIKVHMAPKVQCHHVINTALSVDDYMPEPGQLTASSQGGKIISC